MLIKNWRGINSFQFFSVRDFLEYSEIRISDVVKSGDIKIFEKRIEILNGI